MPGLLDSPAGEGSPLWPVSLVFSRNRRLGLKAVQAEIHKEFRFLEMAAEGGVLAPQHLVETHHGSVSCDLTHDRGAEEGHLSRVELGAQHMDAFLDQMRRRSKVFMDDRVKAGAGRPEFLQPKARPLILEGPGRDRIGRGLLVHEMDLFPQQTDRAMRIPRIQARLEGRIGRGWGGGLKDVLEDFQVEPLLVAEVMGQERQRATCLLGDHAHARAVETVVGKTHQRRLEQGRTGIGGFGFHSVAQSINTWMQSAPKFGPAPWSASVGRVPQASRRRRR